MTRARAPRPRSLAPIVLFAAALAMPALAQPILIPLSPQGRDQPPPQPSPAPVAPPQVDATDVPPAAAGATDVAPGARGADARGAHGTAPGERVEPGPVR